MDLTEKQISSKEIFNGRILHVFDDRVSLPNGSVTGREYIRHIGAVCVIPVLPDGRVVLEKQFRYPVGRALTEIPAGKLDSPDEDRLEAAKRELREETGYDAERWTYLGDYYPAAAYSDERISMYLAQGLTLKEQKLDDDEFLNVFTMPLEMLVKEVMEGNIPDGKTQAAALKAAVLLL
ncbi:MAG: NUDIX hydrolase [Clostridia bacterium]|nr:NUDIX hydrolase [Clostridia bacterium]